MLINASYICFFILEVDYLICWSFVTHVRDGWPDFIFKCGFELLVEGQGFKLYLWKVL